MDETDDKFHCVVIVLELYCVYRLSWTSRSIIWKLGRMVAKLAHANPMTVLRTIVHQIEAYRDMITPVVDAFKYLTQVFAKGVEKDAVVLMATTASRLENQDAIDAAIV